MTTVKTEIGARDKAYQTIFSPTGQILETDVQRAIEAVMEYAVAIAAGLPTTSVDNTVPRFSGTGGDLEGTAVTISDTNFLGTVAGVGIGGATADATNRLSVNTPAVLFNRETANIQVKLNKNAAGDTASFLFQTGFSGRAEIGLVGDDDFQFKVSPNGSAFFTGIIIDKDDGIVNIPLGLTLPVSAAPVVNANGRIALDTTVADFSHGLLRVFGGEEQFIVSLPIAALTAPTGGHVLSYNATNDEFELVAAATSGANTALSNLAAVAINTTLLPGSNDGAALGSGTLSFSDLFLANGGVINWNNGALTLTQGVDTLVLTSVNAGAGAGPTYMLDRNSASPAASDVLGQISFRGRDSAANATDYAYVSSIATAVTNGAESGRLVFGVANPGGGGALTNYLNIIPGVLHPESNDLVALGSGTLSFSDLFLASGAVVNFNNSDVTITHSANALAISGGTTFLDAGAQAGGTLIRTAGKETIWVPAVAMWKNTGAGGPSVGQLVVSSFTGQYLAFDAAALEDAHFLIAMPKSWNEGTVTAQVYWSHPATTTNFAVYWQVFSAAHSDDDALNGASYGSSGTSLIDTGGTTSDLYISPESTAITVANTPADNDMLHFIMRRFGSDGSDTLAVDAYLWGVKIFYTTNLANDT